MEFQLGSGTLMLPSLHITIMAVIIIYFLLQWSKQLETQRYKIFFYFLISTYINPVYSRTSAEGEFQLWFPLGFLFIFFYLFRSESYHPAKMKASILGFCVALYQLVRHYIG